MGLIPSRAAGAEVEAADAAALQTPLYRYPPKSGSYFGSHFLMGGERFEMGGTEGHYLFGENGDLNFLGARSVQFPYPGQSHSAEPTKTLQCLLNIRRDSLKFVRVADTTHYNIEFTFDCDVPISVQILYFATETQDAQLGMSFVSKTPELASEVFHYEMGAGQVFSQPSHSFDPSKHSPEDLAYDPALGVIPVVIRCLAETARPGESAPQAHNSYGVVTTSAEGSGWVLKPLRQKLVVDGVAYLLQEIFGIENKNPALDPEGDTEALAGGLGDLEENGADCVVCMSELRDTLILPCRHLCLCNACAETLRYKASNCPICRSPFRALLQIKTLRRLRDAPDGDSPRSPDGGLARYEAVTLVEALNGPMDHTQTCISLPPPSTAATNATRPSAPPRGGRGHRKKRQPRVGAPIQEVLTPAAITPSTSSQAVEELELEERVEGGMIEVTTESTTPNVLVVNEETALEDAAEHSAASSVGSNKPLLNASGAADTEHTNHEESTNI